MSDEPIRSTPRRQRLLLGLPYGLSSTTILAGLSTALTGRGLTETAPQLPTPPEKPVEAPSGPIGSDVTASFERPTSSSPGKLWVRRKDAIPSVIKHCPCGRRISGNKDHCAGCQK